MAGSWAAVAAAAAAATAACAPPAAFPVRRKLWGSPLVPAGGCRPAALPGGRRAGPPAAQALFGWGKSSQEAKAGVSGDEKKASGGEPRQPRPDCPVCKGEGSHDCPTCQGTGRSKKRGNVLERWKCMDCQGFGFVGCEACGMGGLTPEQTGER